MTNTVNKIITRSSLAIAIGMVSSLATAMQAMSDSELSNARGQALLSLGHTAPSAAGTGANYKDYSYYKMGLEVKVELNANIRSLQLGCGGVNGAGGCDIDIQNLSLSGPADGKLASGEPTWSKGRANTSAVLTNPFLEFAIKNAGSASTREVVGFRLSAEEILGHMAAGTVNDNVGGLSTGGGINSFSGYIGVAPTPVNSFTSPAMFGTTEDQIIYSDVTTIVGDRVAATNPQAMTPGRPGYVVPNSNADLRGLDGLYRTDPSDPYSVIWGVHVPSQSVAFTFPQTSVTGKRMTQLNLTVRDVPIPTIAIGARSGGVSMTMDEGLAGVNAATFFMGAKGTTSAGCEATYNPTNCTYIKNLKANVQVKQNFNLVHNLPLSSGGYLSLQKEALRWPGSTSAFTYDLTSGAIVNRADDYVAPANEIFNAGDIAQPGWWMSFSDPLDFGALNPTTGIPMDDVLPQIATFITNYLSNNDVDLSLGDALGAVFGAPLYKGIGDITLSNDARAVMSLQNLQLDGHQNPVANCWGGLKFC